MFGNCVVLDRSKLLTPTRRDQGRRRFLSDGVSAQSKKSISAIEIVGQLTRARIRVAVERRSCADCCRRLVQLRVVQSVAMWCR
jgi:hypothetical protein